MSPSTTFWRQQAPGDRTYAISGLGVYEYTVAQGWLKIGVNGVLPTGAAAVKDPASSRLYVADFGSILKTSTGAAWTDIVVPGSGHARRFFTDPRDLGTLYFQNDAQALFRRPSGSLSWSEFATLGAQDTLLDIDFGAETAPAFRGFRRDPANGTLQWARIDGAVAPLWRDCTGVTDASEMWVDPFRANHFYVRRGLEIYEARGACD